MIPWMKLGDELLMELRWIEAAQKSGDSRGYERRCLLLDILTFSLKFDCRIPYPADLPRAIGRPAKTITKVCEMAIERGIIRVLPDGSYSTEWLVEKGFVGVTGGSGQRKPAAQPRQSAQGRNSFLNVLNTNQWRNNQ